MIARNVRKILDELPPGVRIVAAAKTRSAEEITEAISAGIGIIGENYVQEALAVRPRVTLPAKWHFIGRLQTNKVKKAVGIFDMIETVDSLRLAREISRRCVGAGREMPVLVEINSGREPQKAGVLPEDAIPLIGDIAQLPAIRVEGLMTMGPFTGDLEDARPCFRETRALFDRIREEAIPGVEMKYLSMGMSNSFRIAIEEGANLVRIGTAIFGPR